MTYPTVSIAATYRIKRQDDDGGASQPAEGVALARPSAPGLEEEHRGKRDQDHPVPEREEAGLRLGRRPDPHLDGADRKADSDGQESRVLRRFLPVSAYSPYRPDKGRSIS